MSRRTPSKTQPRLDPVEYAKERRRKIEEAKRRREEKKREDRLREMGEDLGAVSIEDPQPTTSSNAQEYKSTDPREAEDEDDEEGEYKNSADDGYVQSYAEPSTETIKNSNPHRSSNRTPQKKSLTSRHSIPSDSWRRGPFNPNGHHFSPAVFETSKVQSTSDNDRPTTCISLSPDGSTFVLGSSDHAGYVVSSRDGAGVKRLYTREGGHRDWVSACCYFNSGDIATGGMDGKVCVWGRGRATARDVYTEQGSVGHMVAVEGGILSAGYDGSVCLVSRNGGYEKAANAKKALPPLVNTAFDGQTLMSGANNGLVSLWDVSDGIKCKKAAVGKHGGQVQGVAAVASDTFVTIGIDGMVGLWDIRGPLGSAAGNAIGATACAKAFGGAPLSGLAIVDEGVVVSGGTDIDLLDLRAGMRSVWDEERSGKGHQKPIVSLCVGGNSANSPGVAFSGAMDGNVVAHDLRTGIPLYGMGANKGSAGFLKTTTERLIVSGDDGHALIYEF